MVVCPWSVVKDRHRAVFDHGPRTKDYGLQRTPMNHDADLHPEPPEYEHHTDVSAERLARVYAEALQGAADSTGQTQEVIAEIDSLIDDVLRNDSLLESLFAGAAVGRHARRAAIEKAFTGRASDVFRKFLLVLNEHE